MNNSELRKESEEFYTTLRNFTLSLEKAHYTMIKNDKELEEIEKEIKMYKGKKNLFSSKLEDLENRKEKIYNEIIYPWDWEKNYSEPFSQHILYTISNISSTLADSEKIISHLKNVIKRNGPRNNGTEIRNYYCAFVFATKGLVRMNLNVDVPNQLFKRALDYIYSIELKDDRDIYINTYMLADKLGIKDINLAVSLKNILIERRFLIEDGCMHPLTKFKIEEYRRQIADDNPKSIIPFPIHTELLNGEDR